MMSHNTQKQIKSIKNWKIYFFLVFHLDPYLQNGSSYQLQINIFQRGHTYAYGKRWFESGCGDPDFSKFLDSLACNLGFLKNAL